MKKRLFIFLLIILFPNSFIQQCKVFEIQQDSSEERFFTFKGDSRNYILKKNITRGIPGLTGIKFTINVLGTQSDNARVTINQITDNNNFTSILDSNTINSYYISFLSKTINSQSYWENYAQQQFFYINETNYRYIFIKNDILTIESRNNNYGDWRSYQGNEFQSSWNWKTGWLVYYFLTDYNTNKTINYQYEYKLLKEENSLAFIAYMVIPPAILGLILAIQYYKFKKLKHRIHNSHYLTFRKFLSNKIKRNDNIVPFKPLSEEIFEKLEILEQELKSN